MLRFLAISAGAGLLVIALGVLERGGGFLSLLVSDFPVLLFAEGAMLLLEEGKTGCVGVSVNCSSPPGPPYLGL